MTKALHRHASVPHHQKLSHHKLKQHSSLPNALNKRSSHAVKAKRPKPKQSHAVSSHGPKRGKLIKKKKKGNRKNLQPGIYSTALHARLLKLWWPLKLALRIPFYAIVEDGRIQVYVDRISVWFFGACLMTALLWVIWIWLTAGIIYLFFRDRDAEFDKGALTNFDFQGNQTHLTSDQVRQLERHLLLRYYGSLAVIWSLLGHGAIVSVHLIITCEDHANFIQDWYVAVDKTKIMATRGLNLFVIGHVFFVCLHCGVLCALYYEKRFFPSVYGAANVVLIALARVFKSDEEVLNDLVVHERPYFERLSGLGLAIYIFALLSSRLTMLLCMTITRTFGQAAYLLNRRIEMAMGHRKPVGENAIHLDYVNLYKDHLHITALGKYIGKIFGISIISYCMIMMLCITIELSSIATYEFKRENTERILNTQFLSVDSPARLIIYGLAQVTVTITSVSYFVFIGAQAGEEAMEALDIARRQGIISSVHKRERDFIRSLWLSGSHRNPIIIQPCNMFCMNRGTIVTILGTSFFYFLLMWQFAYNSKQEKKSGSGSRPGERKW